MLVDSPEPIEKWKFYDLRSSIEKFEHQFSAELKKTLVYAVPRRGIFDTERLVDSAHNHLSGSARKIFDPFIISEFRAAGRCFAFGLFSASGFHALRAAEKGLRHYYAAILGSPKKHDLTMGLMASHLQDRLDHDNEGLLKPRDTTLRTIRDVTTFDRNPLTHKELELDEEDAGLLFNRAQGMISMMAKELLDRADELETQLPRLSASEPIVIDKKPVRRARALDPK